jgi:hypothetical protein
MTLLASPRRRPTPVVLVALPWTLASATAAVPLVGRIVADLVLTFHSWQDAVSRFELATVRSSADAPDAEADALQRSAQRLAADVERYVDELAELAVECLSYESGQVAFQSEGETRLYWWPGADAVSLTASTNGISSSKPSRAHPT